MIEYLEKISLNTSYTNNLPKILEILNLSILLTSSSSGKIFKIISKKNELKISSEEFSYPVSIITSNNKIYFSSLDSINLLVEKDFQYSQKNSILFNSKIVPKSLAIKNGSIYYLNSKYSKIESINLYELPYKKNSFDIDNLNVTGFTFKNNKIKYITAKYKDDSNSILYDLEKKEILLDNLDDAFLPKFLNNRLFFCERVYNELFEYDFEKKEKKILLKIDSSITSIICLDEILFISFSKSLIAKRNDDPLLLNPEKSNSGFLLINLKNNKLFAKFSFIDENRSGIIDIDDLTFVHNNHDFKIKREVFLTYPINSKNLDDSFEEKENIFYNRGYKYVNVYGKLNEELCDKIVCFARDILKVPDIFHNKNVLYKTVVYVVFKDDEIVAASSLTEEYIQDEHVYIYNLGVKKSFRTGSILNYLTKKTQEFFKYNLQKDDEILFFVYHDTRDLKKSFNKIFVKNNWELVSNSTQFKAFKYY